VVSSGDGAVELGAAGAPGLGLWGHRGWGKGAVVDLPAGTSMVESEIESRWGRVVGLVARSVALGLENPSGSSEGVGETVGQPDGVGRKKRAPNTCSPMRPWLYTQDDL